MGVEISKVSVVHIYSAINGTHGKPDTGYFASASLKIYNQACH